MPLLDALAEEDLLPGRPRVVRLDGRTIALVRIGEDVHALDDACPHDGYPLSLGELSGTGLRCERHGGRFDVATGQCLRGGEDARRYHAERLNGRVLVQVEAPLAEVEQARLVGSIRQGLISNDRPRLARECVRLLGAGADGVDVVRAAVRYGSERGAGGFNAALAACADFARVAPLFQGLERAIPLTQALVSVAQANRGRGQRPIPSQARGVLVGSADARRIAFVKHIQARDAEAAEAMLTGALYQGLALSEAGQWLLAASCAHVIDGGSTLVHATKALDLCDAMGAREAIFVLPSLVPPLVYGIRDDQSGPLRTVAALVERNGEGLTQLVGRADPKRSADFDDRSIRNTILEGSPTGAFDAVLGALSAGVPPRRVGVAIMLAASERVMRFDDLVEWDDQTESSWDDALRPFMFAVAATKAVDRWPSADTLRGLALAAALVQASRGYELPEGRRIDKRGITASTNEGEAVASVLGAVRTRRAIEAVGLARGYIERGHDPWALAEGLARLSVEDTLRSQQFVERGVGVTIAAVDGWEAAGEHPEAALPLYAAVRTLASDARQRWLSRHVAKAIEREKLENA